MDIPWNQPAPIESTTETPVVEESAAPVEEGVRVVAKFGESSKSHGDTHAEVTVLRDGAKVRPSDVLGQSQFDVYFNAEKVAEYLAVTVLEELKSAISALEA